MKKLLVMSLSLAVSASAMAESLFLATTAPTAATSFATYCADVGCAPIINAKADALVYDGGEISATLQEGIKALDAKFDTSGLSTEQKIQHIGTSF